MGHEWAKSGSLILEEIICRHPGEPLSKQEGVKHDGRAHLQRNWLGDHVVFDMGLLCFSETLPPKGTIKVAR